MLLLPKYQAEDPQQDWCHKDAKNFLKQCKRIAPMFLAKAPVLFTKFNVQNAVDEIIPSSHPRRLTDMQSEKIP